MYLFRREDDGEVVEVDFETMMRQDSLGFITLPDGASARRCVHLEIERDGGKRAPPVKERDKPIVSDALGFCEHQLADFEADRARHGFTGVEFTPDPRVPEFYQVKVGSQKEWRRYVKHRGMIDRNSRNGGGQPISAEHLAEAERLARERFPLTNKIQTAG